MNYQDLSQLIKRKSSCLCVGLDTDPTKIPSFLHNKSQPVLAFNKAIINYTQDLCVAYKINTAFYEAQGPKGWENLQRTIDIIPDSHFIIADAKRGDIGHTAEQYAHTFFEQLQVDAVTLSPYMGKNTVTPFLKYPNKWVILLALTSNASSKDFQLLQDHQYRLFEHVLVKGKEWGNRQQIMFVVGATQRAHFKAIRDIVPHHFLLIPGVGAQGGDLEEVIAHGKNDHCGLLINSSRSIIYAGEGETFAQEARNKALDNQKTMAAALT